jgi:hypothetical protein
MLSYIIYHLQRTEDAILELSCFTNGAFPRRPIDKYGKAT